MKEVLVCPRRNNNGHLLKYKEFFDQFQIPIIPQDYVIVIDAILNDARLLLLSSTLKWKLTVLARLFTLTIAVP